MFTNVTLIYFCLLVPLSGVIAYVGDRIGHKSGKRRHTIFGLRPRHTAMLFTIGAGMCISLASFGLFFLLSATFQQVVREGFQLVETNRSLKESNATIIHGNSQLQAIARQRQQEEEAANSRRDSAVLEEKGALRQRNAAVQQAQHAQAQVRKAQAQVRLAEDHLRTSTRALNDAKVNLVRTRFALQSTQGSLKERSASLHQAELKVADARKNVLIAQNDLTQFQQKAIIILHEQQVQQEKTKADLRKQMDDQTAQFNEQKARQSEELAGLSQQVTAEQLKVATEQQTLAQLLAQTNALREFHITYQVGEEVDRIAIRPGYNVWRIEAILQSFLTTAAKKAEVRGALHDKNTDRAVFILPSVSDDLSASHGKRSDNKEAIARDEDDTVRKVAEVIRRANTDVVVLATATANEVAGEPIAVTLNLHPNPVVIPADKQIGEARIDGNDPSQQIADALYAFLGGSVHGTLVQAGLLLPARGGDNAAANGAPARALSSGVPSLDLSSEQCLNLMERIRHAGGGARVVVTATRDIRAGDPLGDALNFDVKNVQVSSLQAGD